MKYRSMIVLCIVAGFLGIGWGELDLMAWASRAARECNPTAVAYLPERNTRNLYLWVRQDDMYSTSYIRVPIPEVSERVLKIVGPRVGDGFAKTDKFETIEPLLAKESRHVSFFQQVRFMDVVLGSWFQCGDNNGKFEEVGARTFGKSRDFVIAEELPKTVFSNNVFVPELYGRFPLLMSITGGRILWDAIHVVVAFSLAYAIRGGVRLLRTKAPTV